MTDCPNCGGQVPARRNFCPSCGRVVGDLKSIRFVMGTGRHSSNPKVEKFLSTGDPGVFAKPGAVDFQG